MEEDREDIYPLGLGKGLLADVLNFGLNNIYQYGQKAQQSNQQMGQAMNELAAGRPAENLSPLIQEAVNVSPGFVGKINWEGMQPAMTAAMKMFGERFPHMMAKMEAAPQNLSAFLSKDLPSSAVGVLRKPLPLEHGMSIRPGYASRTPWTIGHEMQHSLNAERVAGTDPLDALTIGTLLKDVLPSGNRGSLETVLGVQIAQPSFLQRMTGNVPKQLTVTNPNRNLMRSAMDEGLAYLAENAARPNADPMLKTLAQRLGVDWTQPGPVASKATAVGPDLMAAKEGFKALDDIYKGYAKKFGESGREGGMPYTRDRFMDSIAKQMGWHAKSLTPVSKVRRLIHAPDVIDKDVFERMQTALPKEMTLDVMEAMQKTGMLKDPRIGEEMAARIAKLLERVGR